MVAENRTLMAQREESNDQQLRTTKRIALLSTNSPKTTSVTYISDC